MGDASDITEILSRMKVGDRSAVEVLLPLVYNDLRAQAGGILRDQLAGHTLQPTAVVHEAYLRLVKTDQQSFKNRRHFMAVAATAMRHVLADHARDRRRLKRGGDAKRVTLMDVKAPEQSSVIDLL